MPNFLCITIHFLQPFSHGRGDGDDPEWPPSPLRLFQALVASSAGRWNERTKLSKAIQALNWLEVQTPPQIVSEEAACPDRPYRLYVPDNLTDKVATSWSKGGKADIADYRTEKDVRPMQLSGKNVHYLYSLTNNQCPHINVLTDAIHSITHLGWGIDVVVGDARIMSVEQVAALAGHRWQPTPMGNTQLRVPIDGTLNDLMHKHEAFLNRLSSDGFRPVPPLKVFRLSGYRRDDEALRRSFRIFELRNDDGSFFHYSQRRIIHISGMLRHLAIKLMKKSPPEGVSDDWVETYVAGHLKSDDIKHRQFSYLPLPSIGYVYTNPSIRRVMIVAPLGDDQLLEYLTRRLEGAKLIPTPETKLKDPPTLVRVKYDKVAYYYTRPANIWASVTPVILPGHDDHKPKKTRKLIEKALAQAGIEQACEFEWSAFSRFPKSLSAHKYDRDKKPTGYWRPEYLQSKTAVHLTLRFKDDVKVPGPITIGAGRHCGFGIFAVWDE